jgi:dTDP-4-amino-4,6-dideoxygalactose transaminase
MIDLFRPYMAADAAERVARVLSYDAQGRLYCGQGNLVDEFEEALARFLGAPRERVVTTNSCTSALGIALQLAGVEPGDEVVAPPMTCTATSGAIVNRGAKIVWADVEPLTGNIDPRDVARKVTRRTKAIVAVNWGGRSCDYAALRGHGVPVIEDAAHGPYTGGGGDYVCYSFGPIKHLSTVDGGALVTHRGDAERAELLRWHGLSRRTKADFRCEQPIREAGTKAHMNDFNAAVGLANITDAAWVVGKHRQHAAYYHRHLAGLAGVTVPPPDPASAWWMYPLLVEDRDEFMAHMTERGIATSRVHGRNDAHPAYTFPSGPLPGTDHYDSHVTAIPVGWWLNAVEVARVVEAVRDWATKRARQGVAA